MVQIGHVLHCDVLTLKLFGSVRKEEKFMTKHYLLKSYKEHQRWSLIFAKNF